MILNIILILGIMITAYQFQESKLKIASPLIIIALTMTIKSVYPGFMGFVDQSIFSEEMLVFIVILVLVDAFVLKLKEIKENWLSLTYLAGVSVALSVIMGIFMANTVLSSYSLSVGAIIILFSMCLATDPVSVVSVFQQFKLPHKLKFFAEGESLFNDAVAVIMFHAFGIALMTGTIITFAYVFSATSQILVGSTIIGIIVGFVGTFLLKRVNTTKSELLIVLFTAYLAFYLAEHAHIIGGHAPLSGLLSEIVAILTLTTIIDKSFKYEKRRIEKNKEVLVENISNETIRNKSKAKKYIEKFMTDITDHNRHKDVNEFLGVIALLVNGVLFVSLAGIINVDMLIKYWKEILSMFLVTTLIRAIMMAGFVLISNNIKSMPNINFRWYLVLLFAGIKGGLSIVMLHIFGLAVPNFEYLELFNAIVIGVILLSAFVYVPALMIIIGLNKDKFLEEYLAEKANH